MTITEETLRLYSISISARRTRPIVVSDGTVRLADTYSHLPVVCLQENIDLALDMVKDSTFEYWPASQGWYGHQAAATPFETDAFEAVMKAIKNGIKIGEAVEEPRAVLF